MLYKFIVNKDTKIKNKITYFTSIICNNNDQKDRY